MSTTPVPDRASVSGMNDDQEQAAEPEETPETVVYAGTAHAGTSAHEGGALEEPMAPTSQIAPIGVVPISPVPVAFDARPAKAENGDHGVMARFETPQGTTVLFFEAGMAAQVAAILSSVIQQIPAKLIVPGPADITLPGA